MADNVPRLNQLDVLEDIADSLGGDGQSRTHLAYTYASGQYIAYTGTAARSTAIAATAVLLVSSSRCFFKVGDVTVTATAGAGSIPLGADVPFHVALTSGQYVSVIQDTSAGNLSVIPVI